MSGAPPANATLISEAVAQATGYVVPSVASIFAAGLSPSQVDPTLFYNGSNLTPDSIFPRTFSGLYYNVSYLWPQLDITGMILDPSSCQPQVCSLLWGNFLYLPNIPANAFFAAFFSVAMLLTVALAIRYRTWGFMVGMIMGLLCEILGYIGRIMLARNDFNKNPFYIYIICLTIGPAFLSFSIYTCLARIVVTYGQNLSRFKPKTYTYIFAVCDFISLVLQALGGALATTAKDDTSQKRGINIMIAGLGFQVFSLTVFVVLCADYAIRIHRHHADIDPTYYTLRRTMRFRGFIAALIVATVAIYIRSVFRVAELQQGFKSQFANDEITYMVLEAVMISIATIALTVFHPGVAFGDEWVRISAVIKHKVRPSKENWEPSVSYPTVVVGPNKVDHRGRGY